MEDDDIDSWVDQLAGKPGRAATPEEAAAIACLQSAVMAHAASEADAVQRLPPNELADERAWQKVKIEINPDARASPSSVKRFALPALATAAVLLIGVSLTWRNIADRGEDVVILPEAAPRYHGTVPAIDVRDAAPLRRAKHLAKRLMPFATKPKVYFNEGRATVEFEITAVHLADVIKEITTEGIPTSGLTVGIAQVNFLPQ